MKHAGDSNLKSRQERAPEMAHHCVSRFGAHKLEPGKARLRVSIPWTHSRHDVDIILDFPRDNSESSDAE